MDGHWFLEIGWTWILWAVRVVAAVSGGYLLYVAKTAPEQSVGIVINLAVEAFAGSCAALLAFYTISKLTNLESVLNLRSHVVEPVLEAIARTNSVVHVGVTTLPWPSLFEKSNSVYLIVQGWDKWKNHVGDPLKDFLRRGGQLHVLMPVTRSPNGKPHQHMSIVAHRMNRTADDQINEIEGTEKELRELADELSPAIRSQLHFHYTEKMNWFCGIYFHPHTLVISVYQHKSFDNIASVSAPSFVISVAEFVKLQQWFQKEWTELTGNAPW